MLEADSIACESPQSMKTEFLSLEILPFSGKNLEILDKSAA
jgi:hypothetical protein